MKILRWIITIAITLFVLMTVVIVVMVNFINPNDYREQINKMISEKIHKPFAIQGDISWVFFPSLGFKAQNMRVGGEGAKGFYAQLNSLEINLQLWPLLHKEIALNALKVEGLQLSLPEESSPSDSNTNPAEALAALPALSLKKFSIENATMIKQKTNGKMVWQIKNFAIRSSDLGMENEFPVKTHFNFIYPEKNISAKINFESQIKLSDAAQTVALIKPVLTVDNDKGSAYSGQLSIIDKEVFLDAAKQTLTIKKLSGNFNELNFSGNATVNHLFEDPLINGHLSLQTDHLRAVAAALNTPFPSMRGQTALTQLALNTEVQYGNNQLRLEPFNLEIDRVPMRGSIKSQDVKNLALDVALQLPMLNLGNYLAPSADASSISLNNVTVNFKLLTPGGVEKNWLASTLSGSLLAKKMTYGMQDFKNVVVQVDTKNQMLKLIKLSAEAWGGTINTNGVINLQTATPKFTINPQIQNIQIRELIKTIEPKLKLSGLGSLTGTVSSAGEDAQMIKKNLTGKLLVTVKNGVLQGIDLGHWLRTADAILHKQAPEGAPKNAQTNFGNLKTTLLLNNGIVDNSDLLIQGPVVYVTGQGTADLIRESLRYRLQLAKTNENTGEARNDIVPLLITGSFDNPSIQLDMAALLKQVARRELNHQKDQLLQKVVDQHIANTPLGQQLSGALGKLLG